MTTMQKMGTGLLAGLLMMALGTGAARAQDANPANDRDSITVRITPNVDFGVDIDSAALESGGVIDLGGNALYGSTQTVSPATVTIQGNVAAGLANTGQELDVSGSIANTGAGAAWTFDATPSTWSTSGELDALATYVLFSDTTLSVAPDGDAFSVPAAEFTGTARAGGSGPGNGTKFESGVEMDDLSPLNQRHLWLFFRLPNQTSDTAAQEVTITLTAVNANT